MSRHIKSLALVIGALIFVVAGLAQPLHSTGQAAPSAPPQQPATLEGLLNSMTMRNIGAFRTAAWVSAIDVPESPVHDHLYTIFAASRSGGLWRTKNAGTTWENVTDSVDVEATGAVAISPSNPQIVWVGGGDQANARSSISGKGVFKSTKGGDPGTFEFMGLPDSHHIGRIVIHPKNPDIVYVAALGHLFSRNEERGVFRTMDGGKTWKKVLYIDDGTGAVDLVINRKTPTQLFASMYDKERLPWQIRESGPKSGIYRTDDGGEKWTQLTGGLPTGKIGRIGIDIYQKNPLILYALLENQNSASAPEGAPAGPARAGGAGAGGVGAAAGGVSATAPLARGIIGNELYRTDDGGKTWKKTGNTNV